MISKKILLSTTLFILLFNISCKNKEIVNEKTKENTETVDSTDFSDDHVPVSSEQINRMSFTDMISNSEKFYYTQVLLSCENDMGDISCHLYPDLSIILRGKFDNEKKLLIEKHYRDDGTTESEFEYTDDKLITKNKYEKYSYDIEFRDKYILLIDNSIKYQPTVHYPKVGMIIYLDDPYENQEEYRNLIETDFKKE